MWSALLFAGCLSDSDVSRVKSPPAVSIGTPAAGEVFRQGLPVVAVGQVLDAYDAPDALDATWALDETGEVAATLDADGVTTLTLGATTMALGEHTFTLAATDSDGGSAFAQVTFVVEGPLGPPTVEITAPADGTTSPLGDSITFLGAASDGWTAGEDLEFAWADDVSGAIPGAISDDGQSALVTSDLVAGVHVITLTVTDLDGEFGSDSITVTVEEEEKKKEPPPEPEPGDLIFSEFMVNPTAPDEDGEWVELYNTSGRTLDIAGYSFHDDGVDLWVFDSSVEVESHAYLVLCANPDRKLNGGVSCDGWFYRNPDGDPPTDGHGNGVAIANNDDELVLTGPDGVDIDVFDYNDTNSDPIVAGSAFGVDPNLLDGALNDDIGNWCVQTTLARDATDPGTPGFANDPCF